MQIDVSLHPVPEAEPWFRLTEARVAYRRSDYQTARQVLDPVVANWQRDFDYYGRAAARLLRAMVLYHLDELEGAEQEIGFAQESFSKSKDLSSEELDPNRIEDWLLVQILLREAQELMK